MSNFVKLVSEEQKFYCVWLRKRSRVLSVVTWSLDSSVCLQVTWERLFGTLVPPAWPFLSLVQAALQPSYVTGGAHVLWAPTSQCPATWQGQAGHQGMSGPRKRKHPPACTLHSPAFVRWDDVSDSRPLYLQLQLLVPTPLQKCWYLSWLPEGKGPHIHVDFIILHCDHGSIWSRILAVDVFLCCVYHRCLRKRGKNVVYVELSNYLCFLHPLGLMEQISVIQEGLLNMTPTRPPQTDVHNCASLEI